MKRSVFFISLGLIFLFLGSCSKQVPVNEGIVTESVKLTPYRTATITPTVTVVPPEKPTATLVPTITLTPQVYEVKAKDTLFTIAARNGLTVAELTAANPGVSAYSLYVGTRLVIPAAGGNSSTQSAPTPTPSPMFVYSPKCFPSITGGYYCFALVENREDYDVENLTGEFRLTDLESGKELTQDTFLPLTRLLQGSAVPFYVYFTPPVFDHPTATFRVLSAMPVAAENAGIYPMTIKDQMVEIAEDGSSADISGKARYEGTGKSAKLIRLLVVAYDAEGNVVGLRRYEEEVELKPAVDFEFRISVLSTGGKIDRVEIFGEAQP